jgi:SET domain-containing protein
MERRTAGAPFSDPAHAISDLRFQISDYPARMMLIRTRVGPSVIHGMGLFAAEPVKQGTPVWQFLPGFDHDFDAAQFSALPGLAREHVRWFCFVSKIDGHVILSGDHACFINHSNSHNTGAPSEAADPVTTVAMRDIAEGEEITCDYWSYDADTAWKLGQVPRDAPLGTNP